MRRDSNLVLRLLLTTSFLTLGLSGCANKGPGQQGGGAFPANDPPPNADTGPLLSDEECQKFAQALDRAVRSKDGPVFNELIDLDAVLDRAMVGIEVPEQTRQRLRSGFK